MVAPALATCLGPTLLTPAETDQRKMQASDVVRGPGNQGKGGGGMDYKA